MSMHTTLRTLTRSLGYKKPKHFSLTVLLRRSCYSRQVRTVGGPSTRWRFLLGNQTVRFLSLGISGLAAGFFLYHQLPSNTSAWKAYADSTTSKSEDETIDPFVENPWRNPLPTTLYEKMKIVLGSIILAPIRVILLIPVVLSITFLLSLSYLTSSGSGYGPVHWLRNVFFLLPARILARLALFCAGFYWIKRGVLPPNYSDAPIIVVAQHMNLMDAIACFIFHGATFVGKAEVKKVPIIGRCTKTIQCQYIERQSKESRSRCVHEIKERTRLYNSRPGFWHPLAIYPEGTVTNGRCMLRFKMGAFIPTAPVLPMCIRQPHSYFNPAFVNPHEVVAPRKKAPSEWLLWRILCQFYNRMEISYLPVQRIQDSEGIEEFARRVEGKMAAQLGVPVVDITPSMSAMLS